MVLQGRMKRLEEVRLEVDSRRHTVTALGHQIEKQRAKLSPAAGGTQQKVENQIDQTIRKMQHKENKLAGGSPDMPSTPASIKYVLHTQSTRSASLGVQNLQKGILESGCREVCQPRGDGLWTNMHSN